MCIYVHTCTNMFISHACIHAYLQGSSSKCDSHIYRHMHTYVHMYIRAHTCIYQIHTNYMHTSKAAVRMCFPRHCLPSLCMYACIHVCMHCMYESKPHAYIQPCLFTCTFTCIHTYNKRTHTLLCSMSMHICVHAYMYVCISTDFSQMSFTHSYTFTLRYIRTQKKHARIPHSS